MKKIKIYQTFEEQEQDQLRAMAARSPEENMAVFFKLIKRTGTFRPKDDKPFQRKIVIDHDFRLWE